MRGRTVVEMCYVVLFTVAWFLVCRVSVWSSSI